MKTYPVLPQKSEGFVLVVALIMLVAVTLMIVSSSNLVDTNLKVVQNMESREVSRFSAMAAIEEAMSSNRFTGSPENLFVESCEINNQKCFDVNSDGDFDVFVTVAPPTCVTVTPIRNSDLDAFNSAAEASCYLPPAIYSMCANSVWEFVATATDADTGAEVTVRQGVSILTTLNAIESACPA
jgi:hypothetical protein